MVALSGLDKVRPLHLTRETISGRRPADGADTPGGVFRSGENLPGEGDTADIFRLRPAKTKPQYLLLHPAMPNLRDERLIYTPHHPVRWPYRRRPHLLN